MAIATIKNIDRLTQKLNNISNMELDKAMSQALTLVHGQAKSRAPVGTSGGAGLRGSIKMERIRGKNELKGRVYTNLEYASYVEFGTGIKGNGTYPYDIKGLNLVYRDSVWFIPASEIDEKVAKRYHFKKLHFKDGDYYICYGQPAQPYMYPALKDNEKTIKALFKNGVKTKLEESCKGGR